jgi:hypothetical protein
MTEPDRKAPQEINESERIRYGIKLSDITSERLMEIYKIYDETVDGIAVFIGGHATMYHFMKQASQWSYVEFRFGSRLDANSKLIARVEEYAADGDKIFSFGFNSNLAPSERLQRQKDSNELETKFQKAASDYIKRTGIGIPLETLK